MKTYFMTSKPFRQLITQSSRCVETTAWLPMGTIGACTSRFFVACCNLGYNFQEYKLLDLLIYVASLAPSKSAALWESPASCAARGVELGGFELD